MLLVDNINILKNHYYHLWQSLEHYQQEQKLNPDLLHLEDSRRGGKTLAVHSSDVKTYLHSKYDPQREAEIILNDYKEIEDDAVVIFYGTGLGYHIQSFMQKHPGAEFYIYEPVPEVLYQYLAHSELKELPLNKLKEITLADTEEKAEDFFNYFLNRATSNTIIIELPSHKTAFPKQHEQFQELFYKSIKARRSNLRTDFAFQKRWIINSMKNFKEVLRTPNIFMEKKDAFVGIPALLVAAGPSLNEEIDHVRYIKEQGLAYVFSVGSAINTLLENDIYPHAACTYDPTVHNQKVFDKLVERNIKDIPLIFGSSVGYETLEKYPGPKYHMFTSQDTVAEYFLQGKDGQPLYGVYDAPTIAVITLQLLHHLGFDPIILVGQNLAFKDKKRHSAGVDYSTEVTDEEIKRGLWVSDVSGQQVLTNEGFNNMRLNIEAYIKKMSAVSVINTTKGGADIAGAPFLSLDKVIEKYLNTQVTDENCLISSPYSYNLDHMQNQINKIDKANEQLKKILSKISDILKKIRVLAENGNFEQLSNMYIKLDESTQKMQQNHYYKVFVRPMNRVHYDLLIQEVIIIREEKVPRLKAGKIIQSFGRFLYVCQEDMRNTQDLFTEIKQAILEMKSLMV